MISDYVWRHWNAACFGTLPTQLPGDRALILIIGVDAAIQNSGVVQALEIFGPEIREAILAFRWFGLTEHADILESAAAVSPLVDDVDCERRKDLTQHFEDVAEGTSQKFDRPYYRLDPECDRLVKAFAKQLDREPSAFVRLDGDIP
jgi:hypothetical protein